MHKTEQYFPHDKKCTSSTEHALFRLKTFRWNKIWQFCVLENFFQFWAFLKVLSTHLPFRLIHTYINIHALLSTYCSLEIYTDTHTVLPIIRSLSPPTHTYIYKLEITMTRKSGTHLYVTYRALNSCFDLIRSH